LRLMVVQTRFAGQETPPVSLRAARRSRYANLASRVGS
jgi:hypothetical protein